MAITDILYPKGNASTLTLAAGTLNAPIDFLTNNWCLTIIYEGATLNEPVDIVVDNLTLPQSEYINVPNVSIDSRRKVR